MAESDVASMTKFDAVPADEPVVDPQVGRDGGDIGNREPGCVLSVARRGQGDVARFAHAVRAPNRWVHKASAATVWPRATVSAQTLHGWAITRPDGSRRASRRM
jgi:hypothetical protein